MRRASRWNTVRYHLGEIAKSVLGWFGWGDLKLPVRDWTDEARRPYTPPKVRALSVEEIQAAAFLVRMGVPPQQALDEAPWFLALAEEDECKCGNCRRAAVAQNN